LEFKGVRRLKINTGGSSIDLRVKQKRRHGAMIYGRIGDNTEGHKEERNTQSRNAATKKM
jgi:hypothetical protein